MIDILYLAWNRLEFTRKSFEALLRNTDWRHIDRLIIYDDGSSDGTREYLQDRVRYGVPSKSCRLVETRQVGPVGVMNDYLGHTQEDGVLIKIDNDAMLPPEWLNECIPVMRNHPELDLLGIEAIQPIGSAPRDFKEAEYIGGIGFMRRRIFSRCLPTPRGRFGFTCWQQAHKHVKKGWLDPAIPVCLLNLVPFEPWVSLSKQYVKNGWQRDWPPPLPPEREEFWDWWAPGREKTSLVASALPAGA